MQRATRSVLTAAAIGAALAVAMRAPIAAQDRPRLASADAQRWKAPRTADGQPDMRGYWRQTNNVTTYSLERGEADRATHIQITGQRAATGKPIVDPADGHIPYLPWAEEKYRYLVGVHEGPQKIVDLDPVARGFAEGTPRINLQSGFQILQTPGKVVFLYEYGHHFRVVPLDGRPHLAGGIKLWMGDSRGHWEGNTLVVDVANNNGQTWLQIVGGFHSDAFHVVERWTPTAPDHIVYIATIDDSKVYSRPWKLRVDYRRQKVDEQWESAVWEGNRTADVVLGDAKK